MYLSLHVAPEYLISSEGTYLSPRLGVASWICLPPEMTCNLLLWRLSRRQWTYLESSVFANRHRLYQVNRTWQRSRSVADHLSLVVRRESQHHWSMVSLHSREFSSVVQHAEGWRSVDPLADSMPDIQNSNQNHDRREYTKVNPFRYWSTKEESCLPKGHFRTRLVLVVSLWCHWPRCRCPLLELVPRDPEPFDSF